MEQAKAVVLEHLSDENFGVAELAGALNMSRSNLLRKVKKHTQLSASQFIRQIRLKESMELLRHGNMSVSEISYEVGFGSPSYFIKCFREHYGYPPGEASKKSFDDATVAPGFFHKYRWKLLTAASLAVILVAVLLLMNRNDSPKVELEKKILQTMFVQ